MLTRTLMPKNTAIARSARFFTFFVCHQRYLESANLLLIVSSITVTGLGEKTQIARLPLLIRP